MNKHTFNIDVNTLTNANLLNYTKEVKDKIETETRNLIYKKPLQVNDLLNTPIYDQFSTKYKTILLLRDIRQDLISAEVVKSFNEIASFRFSILLSELDFCNNLKSLHTHLVETNSDKEHIELVKDYYKTLTLNGSHLDDDLKNKLNTLQTELKSLQLKYNTNLQNHKNESFILINNHNEISSLPDSIQKTIKTHKKTESTDNYIIPFSSGLISKICSNSSLESLRKKAYDILKCIAYEGQYSNTQLAQDIVNKNQEIAQTIGFNNASEYLMRNNMAKNATEVKDFLDQLLTNSYKGYQEEVNEIQSLSYKLLNKDIQPHNLPYLFHELYNDKYKVDINEISDYFPLEHTIQSSLEEIGHIFSVRFKKTTEFGITGIHDDIMYYEVTNEQGEYLGGLMLDLVQRKDKRGGGFCGAISSLNKEPVMGCRKPFVFIVSNSTPGDDIKPTLMQEQGVITFLHEMGHAMHHFLSNNKLSHFNGTAQVQRDAVEMPSQLMENFFYNHDFIKKISSHYENKQAIPESIIESLISGKNYLKNITNIRHYISSMIDITIYENKDVNINEVEDAVNKKINLLVKEPQYYREAHSLHHIFTAGYSSGLYVYKWAEILSEELFAHINKDNTISNEAIKAFKDIYAKGGLGDMREHAADFKSKISETKKHYPR